MATQFEKRQAKLKAEQKVADKIKAFEEQVKLEKNTKLDSKTYDVRYNEADKRFELITIEYNFEKKLCKITNVEPFADSQPVALYKYKKLIVDKMMKP